MPTPMTYTEILSAAVSNSIYLQVFGFMVAGLVLALAAYTFKRFGGKTR